MLDTVQTLVSTATTTQLAVSGLVAVVGAYAIKTLAFPKKEGRLPLKPKNNSDRVVVYVFPRWSLSPQCSAACLAVETFLRVAKIPHTMDFSVPDSPTGRWPFIAHKGEYVCDSNTIIEYLTKTYNFKGDDHLTADEKAKGWVILRMLEQGTYFCVLRHRWVDNFQYLKQKFIFPSAPDFVKNMIMKSVRKSSIETLNGQGCGDRTIEEYHGDAMKDARAIEELLDNDGFLFASSRALPATAITSFEAVVYAYIIQFNTFDANAADNQTGERNPWEVSDFVRKSAKIQAFVQRVQKVAFPDYDKLMTQIDGKAEEWEG